MPLAHPSRRSPASPRPKTGGFTFIEVMVALGVAALLAGFSVSMIRSSKQSSSVARARADLAALSQALESYKQRYGDYPQTGGSTQAAVIPTATIGQATAQAQLFNALIGVYGPTNFSTRVNGPMLVELSRFRLEVELTATTMSQVGIAKGAPPMKDAVANAFLDPWGNRYMYYYRPAPVAGRPAVTTWGQPGYLLYSVGPDGTHTAPNIGTGVFTGNNAQFTGLNADNIYATP